MEEKLGQNNIFIYRKYLLQEWSQASKLINNNKIIIIIITTTATTTKQSQKKIPMKNSHSPDFYIF